MAKTEAPKIDFPCENYPIKVMGETGKEFEQAVLKVMRDHAPGFDREKVTVRASRNGNYQSITVYICAEGVPQLQAIFEDLKKHPSTRMVL